MHTVPLYVSCCNAMWEILTHRRTQPYQVEPYGGERGNQVGYNKCNSTTENQESYCQTLIVNGIDGTYLSCFALDPLDAVSCM